MKKFPHLSFLDMTLNLRDSRLAKGTDRAVLYTLNSRVRPEDRYSCFLSLDSIANDAGLNVKTVKRSIDRLAEANLLQKVQRFDNSNVYYLNVARMQDEAEKNRARVAAEKEQEECAFAPPRVAAKTTDMSPVDAEQTSHKLEPIDNQNPSEDESESVMDKIINLLREHFGDHVTLTLPNYSAVLKAPLQACIDMAGSAEKCLSVLTALCTDDSFKEAKARVAASKHLGGYFKGCFKDLMAKVGEESPKTMEDQLRKLVLEMAMDGPRDMGRNGINFDSDSVSQVNEVANWLLENFPNDITDLLLDDRSKPLDKGVVQSLTLYLSNAYQASVLLSNHSGQNVSVDDLRLRDDLEVGAVVRWAVADSRWNDRLKKASDVTEFFLDSLTGIHP
jgi:Helix-turn-helix domain